MARSQRMVYQTDETRQRIIDSATATFMNKGFFDAQMKDIAEAVGMSRHTLYRYYQDKFDLGIAVFEMITRVWSERFQKKVVALKADADRPILDNVRLLMQEMLHVMNDVNELQFIAEFDAYSSSHKAPVDIRDRLIAALDLNALEYAEELMEQGQKDGSIRDDKAPRQLLMVITESLFATQQRVLLRGDLLVELQASERAWLIEELLELMLKGIASDK